jgi:hypothetical protein
MSLTVFSLFAHHDSFNHKLFNKSLEKKINILGYDNLTDCPLLSFEADSYLWSFHGTNDFLCHEYSKLDTDLNDDNYQIFTASCMNSNEGKRIIQMMEINNTKEGKIKVFDIKIGNYLRTCFAFYSNPIQEYQEFLEVIKKFETSLLIRKKVQKYEHVLRDLLWHQLGGKTEVKTPIGFIDLLTNNEIIEIKNFKDWKHGVGQLKTYQYYYPEHKARLHLFNVIDYKIEEIVQICKHLDIYVTYTVKK